MQSVFYLWGRFSKVLEIFGPVRESSFNMTRGGGMKILRGEGGSENFWTPERGALKKIVGLGAGAPKICILQNQQEREGVPKKLNR